MRAYVYEIRFVVVAGLDPEADSILEIACVLTDGSLSIRIQVRNMAQRALCLSLALICDVGCPIETLFSKFAC
jgi:hypothetical protein